MLQEVFFKILLKINVTKGIIKILSCAGMACFLFG